MMGRAVCLEADPERIVSLVPSTTELLFDLGLGERVVGVTRYCIRPPEARARAGNVGGTKQFDFAAIDALQPDVIIGNKEENYREGIDALASRYPVWMSDVDNLDDARDMILELGSLLRIQERTTRLARLIELGFQRLDPLRSPLRAAYLIWRKPYWAVGTPTFVDSLMSRLGLVNVFQSHPGGRYPSLAPHELTGLRPDLVLLSSEPFPFRPHHVAELSRICPGARVENVDGEMFSWPGSRLILAARYFKRLVEEWDRLTPGSAQPPLRQSKPTRPVRRVRPLRATRSAQHR